MEKSQIWDIVIKVVSTAITLATLIYSIILGRKNNSKKLKIVKYAYDKDNNECKNGLLCYYLYISLANVGNRNIEIKCAKIELCRGNKQFLNLHLTNSNNKIDIDDSISYEIYCSTIKKDFLKYKDKIRQNKKLTIYFYDTTNKKYKVKFKIKLLDILNQKEEERKSGYIKTINLKEITK